MAQIPSGIIVGQQINTNAIWYRKKHEKQSTSLTPALLILMGCGIFMCVILHAVIRIYLYEALFFGAVCIGVITTAILLKMLRKVIFYYSASICLIIAGAVFVSFNGIDREVISTTSFFTGLSFGISLVTFIIHGGEIAVQHLRGTLINNLQLSIDGGIFIGIVIMSVTLQSSSIVENITIIYKVYGSLMIIFGICALVGTYFCVYESPIFLLEAGNEGEALNNLVKLRKEPNNMSYEVQNEMKIMRITLQQRTNSFDLLTDTIPIIKILLCRITYTLGTTVFINNLFINYIVYLVISMNTSIYLLCVIYIARFLCHLIPSFLIDKVGRKILFLISFIGSGLCLLITQAIVSAAPIESNVIIVIIFYNVFLSLGSSTVSYIYMSEVFEHSKKTYINGLILTIEYLVQLIIASIFTVLSNETVSSINIYVFFVAGIQILVGALSFALLPETKGKTLLEAQQQIKSIISLQR